jgi:hypothetical protein
MFAESINGSVYGVLVGVIAGGIITTGATLFLENRKEKKTASALAHAFRGELKALQAIVRKRRYVEGLRNVVTHVQSSHQPYDFVIRVSHEYFNVFRSNIDKIGTLKNPLPERIAEFYVTANSILEDLKLIAEGLLKGTTAEGYLEFYSSLLQLFEEAMNNASEIVSIIDEEYP